MTTAEPTAEVAALAVAYQAAYERWMSAGERLAQATDAFAAAREAQRAALEARDARIRAAAASGVTQAAIARATGLSRGRISQICRDAAGSSRAARGRARAE